jgi:NhaP-type Na+/H+ or K+/H+ antiporter
VAVAHAQMPLLLPADLRTFHVSLLVVGVVLILGALLSGIAGRSFLSLTALFVLIGFLLGPGATDWLHFDARSEFVEDIATIALIVILFRDGLEVDGEMLQEHWHLPLRKLVLAMPVTCVIVAVAAKALVGLSWTESFLLGALLTPTDPVLSSGVVTNPRVPRIIRHSLNLESGLNDALALPAVLAFASALTIGGERFVWWRFVLQDVSIGLATGLLVGFVAARLMPRGERLDRGIPPHQKSLYALGTAFAAYGFAVLPPHGNGLIAVFVAAITLGIRRVDIRGYFERQAADLVEIVKVGIFLVFGSLLTLHGLFGDGWPAIGIAVVTLFIARPVAVFGALAGTNTDFIARAFMSWFGPKGVGTMTFSLLVLGENVTRGGQDLQHRRAGGVVLGHRPRADRHAGRRLDRAANRAAPARDRLVAVYRLGTTSFRPGGRCP